MKLHFKAVFAVCAVDEKSELGFGYMNGLPWTHCKEDLKLFVGETLGGLLLMGGETFRSLPSKLRGRPHVVLGRGSLEDYKAKNGDTPDLVIKYGDFNDTVRSIKNGTLDSFFGYKEENIAVIGGKKTLNATASLFDEMVVNILHTREPLPVDTTISFPILLDYASIHNYMSKDYEQLNLVESQTFEVNHKQITKITQTKFKRESQWNKLKALLSKS